MDRLVVVSVMLETAEQPKIHVKPRKRRISSQDIEAIAEMVGERLTESEACRHIGIEPRAWFKFRQSHDKGGKISALLERTRATQLAAHIANIKDAEHGRNGHRPDWRASAHLLAIKAPDRFSTNQAQTVTINQSATVLAIGGPEQLKRMLQLYHRPADVQVADSKTLELTSPGEYSGKD